MLKRHVGYSARGVGERMLLVDGEVCRVRGHGLTGCFLDDDKGSWLAKVCLRSRGPG
jgi:hypothetical protein